MTDPHFAGRCGGRLGVLQFTDDVDNGAVEIFPLVQRTLDGAGKAEVLLFALDRLESLKNVWVVPVLAYSFRDFFLYRKKILSEFPDASLMFVLWKQFAYNDCCSVYGMIPVYHFPLDFYCCFHHVPPCIYWNHSSLTYIIPHHKT